MTKIILPDVMSGYNLSAINSNFQKIEDTLNKEVLYRKGYLGEPNEMQTNLDMNGKQILNVTTGTSDGSLVTKGYVDQGLALKFDKSGGQMSGSVDMGSNEIINVSRLSTDALEIDGVPVVPTNLAVYYYNETREALRRSYAEAGYKLVDGSFEVGGTLVNADDVLLQERTGKAFSGPAGTVAAGTNPASGGFVDRSGVLAKLQVYQDLDDLKGNPPPVGSLVKWMVDDASNLSQKNGGEGIVTSSTTGTSAYIDIGNGTYIFRTNLYGPMEILTPVEVPEDHLLFRNRAKNTPSRIHMEPNGFFDGTKSKLDWMFDPYDQTPQVGGRPRDYRIFNIYTKTGGSLGQSGEAVINVKNVGDFWGVWPSMNFSVSDNGASAFKLMYFDTSDTEWRTPFRGRWREGESFTSGDYVTCANKIYRCDTTGVAGPNRITHESGTVSDGNLDWTWIRSPISNIAAIQPCALFGDLTDMPKFGLSGVRVQYARDTATWSGAKHYYLAGNGTVSGYFSSTATNGIVEYTSASGMKFQFGPNYFKTLGMLQRFDRGERTATTSIDFAGKEVIAPTSPSPVNVTDFLNVVPDSIIKIIPRTNNMTLVHNANKIRLTGGANFTMSDNNFYMFYIDSSGVARQLG